MNYEIKYYPDGSHYVLINDFPSHITFRINQYSDLWVLKQIKDVYDFNKVPLSITIPCLLDAQADRRFSPRQPHGLKLICDFINSLNFRDVSVFHPHNPEVVESLINNVTIIDNSSFVSGVLSDFIGRNYNITLMSSDAGGFKPLIKTAEKIGWSGDIYSASKGRIYDGISSSMVQQIDRDDFNGNDIVIIDDLCVFGGTFVGIANLLKNKNAGKLYLIVSHITVEKVKGELSIFDAIYTTNSKFEKYNLSNINVVKLF